MSKKEWNRCQLMKMLEEKVISQIEVATRSEVTTRHVRRLKKAYQAEGLKGLVSKKERACQQPTPTRSVQRKSFKFFVQELSGLWIYIG